MIDLKAKNFFSKNSTKSNKQNSDNVDDLF